MALKSRYNLVSARGEYSRYYPEFRGADFSTNPTDIEAYRLADALNVWRDPESEYGGACETFPGFRRLNVFEGKINGIFYYRSLNDGKTYVCIHAGTNLCVFDHEKRDELTEENIKTYAGLSDSRSTSFVWQNKLHILDGTNYYKLDENAGKLVPVSQGAYVPISYSDGKEYEQRNMLTSKFKNQYNLGNLSDYEELPSMFAFDIDEKGGAIITGFSKIGSASSTLRIPASVDNDGTSINVTAIGDGAFCGLPEIVTLIIPSTVERIGDGAFCDCANLRGLYFEGNEDGGIGCASIGSEAFCRCGFSEVSLIVPDTHPTLNVGERAFSDCSSLSFVTLSSKIHLESHAFNGGADDIWFYVEEGTDRTALDNMDAAQTDLDFTVISAPNARTDITNMFKGLSSLKLKQKYTDIEFARLIEKYDGKSIYVKGDLDIFIQRSILYFTDSGEALLEASYRNGKWDYNEVSNYNFDLSGATYIADAVSILFGIEALSSVGDITLELSESDSSVHFVGNGGSLLCGSYAYRAYFALTAHAEHIDTEDKHQYKFLIYDPCDSLTAVTLDGQDVASLAGTSYTTESDGSYVSAINIVTTTPELLNGGKLIIEGVGASFKTIPGHSDAITGNSAYSGDSAGAISRCTLACVFDGRVFLSGNPALPNTVFYSGKMLNGEDSPGYFGILNYFNDGVGNSPVKALSASSSVLMVIKGDTMSEGSIYYHSGADTGLDIIPRIYPSVQGVEGLGCIANGAACNFLDDSVFVSRRGLEAVGKETVNLERTIEHRSYNIDSRLPYEDLTSVRLAEWLGYLVLCTGERWYLADSRQIFQHKSGIFNYEWYVLDGFKTYSEYETLYHTLVGGRYIPLYYLSGGSFVAYTAAVDQLTVNGRSIFADVSERSFVEDLVSESSNVYVTLPDGKSVRAYAQTSTSSPLKIRYVDDGGNLYIVDTLGEISPKENSIEDKCTELCSVDKVLYFGTDSGAICCINNDRRGEARNINGELAENFYDAIPSKYYVHDMTKDARYGEGYTVGRRYLSGITLKSDNCDIPHLTKTTRRNSIVVRYKTFDGKRFKVRCKTDFSGFDELDSAYNELERVTASDFDFSSLDFGSMSFVSARTQVSVIREHYRNRKWIEQQFAIYSNEYMSPFGIYSLAFRYRIGGRIKT